MPHRNNTGSAKLVAPSAKIEKPVKAAPAPKQTKPAKAAVKSAAKPAVKAKAAAKKSKPEPKTPKTTLAALKNQLKASLSPAPVKTKPVKPAAAPAPAMTLGQLNASMQRPVATPPWETPAPVAPSRPSSKGMSMEEFKTKLATPAPAPASKWF